MTRAAARARRSACWPAAGIWLLLRARTFDVILGLTLLSYAVNLFIFVDGPAARRPRRRSSTGARADAGQLRRPAAAGAGADRDRDQLRDDRAVAGDRAARADSTGTDHVDGSDADGDEPLPARPRSDRWPAHWIVAAGRAAAAGRRAAAAARATRPRAARAGSRIAATALLALLALGRCARSAGRRRRGARSTCSATGAAPFGIALVARPAVGADAAC